MSEQISNIAVQPSVPSSPPIALWTPSAIAGITFFLGFPAGIVIASINWMRMNLKNKALTHLIAGAVGTFIFLVALLLMPGSVGTTLALVFNLGTLFYLRNQMKNDLESFKVSNNNIANANWFGACLIGLVILVLYFVLAFALAFVFASLGVP